MKHYHFIFTGAGLSALMTVYEMVLSGKFKDKSILLLDENSKTTNDRTWCFWDDNGMYDDIAHVKWNAAWFKNETVEKKLNLHPYQYKMIKGLDFYTRIFELISKEENITFHNQKIHDFQDLGTHCLVKTEQDTFSCTKIFNSIPRPEVLKSQTKYPLLHQHFIGWFIKSNEPVFNPDCATFMDFTVEQKGNTRFMYVLPTTSTEALVEYTLFSADLLQKDEYEAEIKKYIEQLGINQYQIVEKEQGNIPMTAYHFWKHNTKNILNIGSVGGWTKASTGYTFKNAIKKSKQVVVFLSANSDFRKFHKKDKFWFYDLLFLDVLYRRNDLGSEVFTSLFKKGDCLLIFKFLDEETSFLEDLRVLLKCSKVLFIRALCNRVFSRF